MTQAMDIGQVQTLDKFITNNLGFPSQALSKWSSQEIQSQILCSWWHAGWVEFIETWATVVWWTMFQTMLILATKLDLVSAQANITAAFVHANLGHDEHIYVHQAAGF